MFVLETIVKFLGEYKFCGCLTYRFPDLGLIFEIILPDLYLFMAFEVASLRSASSLIASLESILAIKLVISVSKDLSCIASFTELGFFIGYFDLPITMLCDVTGLFRPCLINYPLGRFACFGS